MVGKKLTAKQGRIVARLEQIRRTASSEAAKAEDKKMANLAEEAAQLALELFLEDGE